MKDAIFSAISLAFGARTVAVTILLAAVLAFAGPFGTYDLSGYGLQLIYWFLVVFTSNVIGSAAFAITTSYLDPRRTLLVDLASTVLMAVAFTPILFGLTHGLIVRPPDTGPGFWQLFGYVLPVAFCVYTVRRLIPGMAEVAAPPEPRATTGPRIVRRLPEPITQPILRLSSDDHMVEVVTSEQTYRIRMRLSDAVEEMDGTDGFLTHRSHWVARSAISEARKNNGKLLLQLVNGDTVPVSRTYRTHLETAGVL